MPAACDPNPCESWQQCTTISAVTDLTGQPDDVINYLSNNVLCLGELIPSTVQGLVSIENAQLKCGLTCF